MARAINSRSTGYWPNGGHSVNKFSKIILLSASATIFTGAAHAQQSPSQSDTPAVEPGQEAPSTENDRPTIETNADDVRRESRSADPAEEIEVTGSRLSDGDVTSRKIVIDREAIKARGVTSVEELIRTLPQNLATIGAVVNERGRGPLANRRNERSISGVGSLGVSAANLGGTGAANTLVLVNGRRLAGAAGIEDGFVNLNGIPLSAIERVEIIPSGAAAVYGADALSGVINFILRKDFRGVSLGSQTLYSSNGGNNARFNAYGGYAWNSGSISGTVDYTRRHPVVNSKTGYVTENYSEYYGGDPRFDFRRFDRGLQPGVIDASYSVFEPEYQFITQGLTVRPGVTGRPALTDFITIDQNAAREYIPYYAGPSSNALSASLNIDQAITGKLKFFANGLWSRTKNSEQTRIYNGLALTLAPGQYYNPFPAFNEYAPFSPGTTVYYFPAAEVASGDLVPGRISNTSTQWSVNAGFTYDVNKDTRLNLIYTTSQAQSRGRGLQFGSVVSINEDSSPAGFSCYNFDLSQPSLQGRQRELLQAAFDRQCRALTSTDPNVAFNPFRSTGTGGGDINDFLYETAPEQRTSRLSLYEARLTGTLLKLPAGGLTYAIGAEYADDGVDGREVNQFTGGAGSRDRYAGFAEVSLPILGKGYDLPLVHSLTFNLAGRRDTYKTEGPIGTVDGVPVSEGGQLIFGRNEFTRFTPSFGVRYQPFADVSILAKWGRGFQPPPYTQLFNPGGTQRSQTVISDDPYYTCTTDCAVSGRPQFGYRVPIVGAPNPDLRPQTSRQESFTIGWQPSTFLAGLRVDATYNRTVIRGEFGNLDDVRQLLNSREAYALGQFYPRDANGKITQQRNLIFNLIGSEYKSMTYEISYLQMTSIGNFEPRLTLVDNLTAVRRGLPTSAPISRLGTLQGPDDYRLVGSLGYARDHVALTLWGYHTPSYVNDYLVDPRSGIVNTQDAIPVGSYTTFDLTGSWTPAGRLRFNMAIRNLFDEKPPFVVVEARPYDAGRYDMAGRTAMLQVEYQF